MYARGVYTRPPEDRFAMTPGRIAFLVVVGLTSAVLAFVAGKSIGADTSGASALSGTGASHHDEALSTRLSPARPIGRLDIPAPPPPAETTPTTTGTTPTTDQFNSTPQQSAPSPSPAPAPAPSPAPSAPSGGGGGNGGSFDDSG